jgi:hypothetical protein
MKQVKYRRKYRITVKLNMAFILNKDTCIAYTVEPGYNDIGLYNTPSITSDIMWYHLIPHYTP